MDPVLFARLDALREHIDHHRQEPAFRQELRRRQSLEAPGELTAQNLLRHLSYIMAYAHADALRVTAMMETGAWSRIWGNFDLEFVSNLNPCVVAEEHWVELSSIMSRAKIFYFITAARIFSKRPEVAYAFQAAKLPARISSLDDLQQFWSGFQYLQKQLDKLDIPFLRSTTSLLHLLLHLGYDCLKPDVIVMRAAHFLGMCKAKPSDAERKSVVRTLQEYALARSIRPGILDMYLLIQEGQSEAQRWVAPGFTPLYAAPAPRLVA